MWQQTTNELHRDAFVTFPSIRKSFSFFVFRCLSFLFLHLLRAFLISHFTFVVVLVHIALLTCDILHLSKFSRLGMQNLHVAVVAYTLHRQSRPNRYLEITGSRPNRLLPKSNKSIIIWERENYDRRSVTITRRAGDGERHPSLLP